MYAHTVTGVGIFVPYTTLTGRSPLVHPNVNPGSNWYNCEHTIWIGLFGVMVWAVLRSTLSLNQRSLPAPEEEPSALERLRRRYILGQIDIEAFEEGLVEVLELEEQDRPRL